MKTKQKKEWKFSWPELGIEQPTTKEELHAAMNQREGQMLIFPAPIVVEQHEILHLVVNIRGVTVKAIPRRLAAFYDVAERLKYACKLTLVAAVNALADMVEALNWLLRKLWR